MTPNIGCNDALDVHLRVNAMLMTYVSYVGLEGRTGLTYGLQRWMQAENCSILRNERDSTVFPQFIFETLEKERVDNIITNLQKVTMIEQLSKKKKKKKKGKKIKNEI